VDNSSYPQPEELQTARPHQAQILEPPGAGQLAALRASFGPNATNLQGQLVAPLPVGCGVSSTFKEISMKIMKCVHCHGTDVMRDAWAVWDSEKQDWTLGNVFDQAQCNDCDRETSLVEEEVPGDPPLNFYARITRTPCNFNRSEVIALGEHPELLVRVENRAAKYEKAVFDESSIYRDYVIDEIYTLDDQIKTVHYRDSGLSFLPSMSQALLCRVKDVLKVVKAP
jgi:hypothetical protein